MPSGTCFASEPVLAHQVLRSKPPWRLFFRVGQSLLNQSARVPGPVCSKLDRARFRLAEHSGSILTVSAFVIPY